MAATKQIFRNSVLSGQRFITKWRIEFHENPTNVLVAIVRSQTDRRKDVHGIHTRHSFLPSQKMSNDEFHGGH